MEAIWKPEGYFNTQTKIWEAQSEARHELLGKPSYEELQQIKSALQLTPEDIIFLNEAKGHETNKLLRRVQSRLPAEVGNYIHKGNTSSDVLDTSLSLQIIGSLNILRSDFGGLKDSLLGLALKHKETLQVGRTHGQHAIPQTFGRQVLGWYAEVERGLGRIERAKEVIAFGKCSGEVGTNVFIAPDLEELALAKLGLKPDPAPTQIISRDRHTEVVSLVVVNSATLGRIATNIRLLAMTDVGEVREPFDTVSQQGSSAMPHKRNPEISERIDGLNRRIRGAAGEELDSSLSWLERDISHSSAERFTFPDLFSGLSYATRLTKEVIDGLVVNSGRMAENLERTYGAIYSSRLMNTLIDKGVSRTEAYDLTKDMAQTAMDEKVQLKTLAGREPKIIDKLSVQELNGIFDPSFYLKNIDVAYRRLGLLK